MIKILSIFMATLAAISPVVQAGACTPGINYCGSTLITYGKAPPSDELRARQFSSGPSFNSSFSEFSGLPMYLGFNTASALMSDALYHCQPNGAVTLLHKCIGAPCVDGGAGLDDHCFVW